MSSRHDDNRIAESDGRTQGVQSLEISSGDLDDSAAVRVVSSSATHRGIVTLPLFILLSILGVMKSVLGSVLPVSAVRSISNFIESNRENGDILREMPGKQRELKQNMNSVERDQMEIQRNMDNLRLRIQKIEERRERWAEKAERIREAEMHMATDDTLRNDGKDTKKD